MLPGCLMSEKTEFNQGFHQHGMQNTFLSWLNAAVRDQRFLDKAAQPVLARDLLFLSQYCLPFPQHPLSFPSV